MLCHRYTICVNGVDATPVSALEMAVDMHSTIVIGSSGYQRCIKWLWRGWIIQSSTDPIPMSCTREQHRNHLELILILPESKLPCIKIF